ncbi:hypothetical protein [Corynebacterium pacaense]|uniref:hypothetical protein n=1 Tax=Corynebacterium pacaense TaxID=1816684 RepID=UPI0009B9DA93|nr:hypothetical protein [Corynebacterium pacaense]
MEVGTDVRSLPGADDLADLRRLIADLELTVARQRQLIDTLFTATGGEATSTPASLVKPRPTLHPDVIGLRRRGRGIAAINRHRELTGTGFAEAKGLIDTEEPKVL